MNKKLLFFALIKSFCVFGYWPGDFSFTIQDEQNYSCERHSIMSQLSQEYKDNDCMSHEEVLKMAGLDKPLEFDSPSEETFVEKDTDVVNDESKTLVSSKKNNAHLPEFVILFIKAVMEDYLENKYKKYNQPLQADHKEDFKKAE